MIIFEIQLYLQMVTEILTIPVHEQSDIALLWKSTSITFFFSIQSLSYNNMILSGSSYYT